MSTHPCGAGGATETRAEGDAKQSCNHSCAVQTEALQLYPVCAMHCRRKVVARGNWHRGQWRRDAASRRRGSGTSGEDIEIRGAGALRHGSTKMTNGAARLHAVVHEESHAVAGQVAEAARLARRVDRRLLRGDYVCLGPFLRKHQCEIGAGREAGVRVELERPGEALAGRGRRRRGVRGRKFERKLGAARSRRGSVHLGPREPPCFPVTKSPRAAPGKCLPRARCVGQAGARQTTSDADGRRRRHDRSSRRRQRLMALTRSSCVQVTDTEVVMELLYAGAGPPVSAFVAPGYRAASSSSILSVSLLIRKKQSWMR